MSDAPAPPDRNRLRTIRSYVVRAGRMTPGQQKAMDDLWPRYGVAAGDTGIDLPRLFGRAAPVSVEIGFGNGDNLAALCSAHPERDFIGIEVHPPGVGTLLGKAATDGLTNLRVVRQDAVEVLEKRIAPASLDAVLVLFPDPWHKTRHHKRRLISGEFAALVASRLAAGGTFQLATDWTPYAEVMLEVLNKTPGLKNLSADGRYVPRNPGRIRTRFEARGERLGHAVHDLCYERI